MSFDDQPRRMRRAAIANEIARSRRAVARYACYALCVLTAVGCGVAGAAAYVTAENERTGDWDDTTCRFVTRDNGTAASSELGVGGNGDDDRLLACVGGDDNATCACAFYAVRPDAPPGNAAAPAAVCAVAQQMAEAAHDGDDVGAACGPRAALDPLTRYWHAERRAGRGARCMTPRGRAAVSPAQCVAAATTSERWWRLVLGRGQRLTRLVRNDAESRQAGYDATRAGRRLSGALLAVAGFAVVSVFTALGCEACPPCGTCGGDRRARARKGYKQF